MKVLDPRRIAALAVFAWMGVAHAQVDVDAFVREDTFEDVKLSPDGSYFAATVPLEDRTVLVVIRRSDNAVVAKAGGDKHSVVYDFQWATPDRVLVSLARRDGVLDAPAADGLLAVASAVANRADRRDARIGELRVGAAAMLGVGCCVALTARLQRSARCAVPAGVVG